MPKSDVLANIIHMKSQLHLKMVEFAPQALSLLISKLGQNLLISSFSVIKFSIISKVWSFSHTVTKVRNLKKQNVVVFSGDLKLSFRYTIIQCSLTKTKFSIDP